MVSIEDDWLEELMPAADAAHDALIYECIEFLELGYEQEALQVYLLSGESLSSWNGFLQHRINQLFNGR